MAEKTVTVISLNGANYPTWKIQCQMTLMKDGLWGIVNGTESAPTDGNADRRAKFEARKNRALAVIVLSLDPALLYLLGDLTDPVAVWKILSNQFQKKTWANRLALRRILHSARLKEGQLVQEHIKLLTETFNELAVVGDNVSDKDHVIYLLASLPDTFDMLVTALEANNEVPKMETVTERLLYEEQKLKDCMAGSRPANEEAMTIKHNKRRGPRCHHCKRYGQIKRNCRELQESNSENNH